MLVAGFLAACSDATDVRPAPRLDGSYTATTFTGVIASDTFDLIAEGVSLAITLAPDGRTTGSLFVPDSLIDLAGTWDTAQGMLHFHPVNGNILARIPFRIQSPLLRGRANLGPGTVDITLAR